MVGPACLSAQSCDSHCPWLGPCLAWWVGYHHAILLCSSVFNKAVEMICLPFCCDHHSVQCKQSESTFFLQPDSVNLGHCMMACSSIMGLQEAATVWSQHTSSVCACQATRAKNLGLGPVLCRLFYYGIHPQGSGCCTSAQPLLSR